MTDIVLLRVLEQVQVEILAGRPEQALQLATGAVEAFGGDHRAHYALAAALAANGLPSFDRMTAAQDSHALRLLADAGMDLARLRTDAEYAMAVARHCYNADHLGAASLASACTVGAPDIANGLNMGLHVLAQALFHQGFRMEPSLRAFAAAFKASPNAQLYSAYLRTLTFAENGRVRHAAEAKGWARICADPFAPAAATFDVDRSADRRLRIGYIAPSFNAQLGQFCHWLIDGHAPDGFEVFAYVDDAAVETFGDSVNVRSIRKLDDEAAAAVIRDDRLDVLIETWGHAVSHRLPMLARKLAPVQVSWLNYIQTTGMTQVDYVIHADFMDSPRREALFTEQIVSNGPVMAAFRPSPTAAASPAPALRKGYVTFGSYNHPNKVSEATLAAWARILRAVPSAKLVLKYRYYADPVVQETYRAKLLGLGADPAALVFEGFSRGADYDDAFGEIDLMLDTSPVNGGTTTLEAFSHGVPVLTYDDRSDYFARLGRQAMEALHMPQMATDSWDDYVAKAIALAHDVEGLAALRAQVRPAFDASSFRDEAGFIGRMEDLYRAMFEAWLARDLAEAAAA